jgi:hypothetical protein
VTDRAHERHELGRGLLRGAQHSEDHSESFHKVRESVLEAERNPGILAERIQRVIEPIAKEQPEVASAMAQKLVADQKWLASKLPQPLAHFGTTLAPADQKPLISKHEQRRLVSYAGALHSTERTLHKLASGQIDFDALDAIKERRPALYDSIRQRVAFRLSEPGAEVSHRRRVMLSVLFDVPGDPSMAPGVLSAIGQSLAPPPDQAPGPSPSKVDPQKFTAPMATPSQQATT